jgi:hypothetical protein
MSSSSSLGISSSSSSSSRAEEEEEEEEEDEEEVEGVVQGLKVVCDLVNEGCVIPWHSFLCTLCGVAAI